MSIAADVQAATLQRSLDAWSKWDAEAWLAVFTEDYTQVTMPFGLGVPNRSRSEVEQALPALTALVKAYKLTVHNIVHDVKKNKAAVDISSTGDLPWGPWKFECSAFITFSEAGDKVAKVEEMIDTAFMRGFGPRFGEYLRAHGGPRVPVSTVQ